MRRGNGSEYSHGLGQSVHILDPFDEVQLKPALKSRFNPLDTIDPNSSMAVDDARRMAACIVISDGPSKDKFFDDAALDLIQGVILHVLTDKDFEGKRNLVTVWRLITQGDWQGIELLTRHEARENPRRVHIALGRHDQEHPL